MLGHSKPFRYYFTVGGLFILFWILTGCKEIEVETPPVASGSVSSAAIAPGAVTPDKLSVSYLALAGGIISGQLTLNSNFKILPGAAAGKVLTSDVNGNATWQTPTGGGGVSGSGLGLYDANGVRIGNVFVVGEYTILLLSDGKFVAVDLLTGSVGFSLLHLFTLNNGLNTSNCYYTSIDCSGTCYIKDTVARSLKNSVVANSTGFLVATGLETVSAGVSLISERRRSGSCIADSATGNFVGISTPYTLPSDLILPLAAPLYFGP